MQCALAALQKYQRYFLQRGLDLIRSIRDMHGHQIGSPFLNRRQMKSQMKSQRNL